jgi:hypothetical protein
LDERALTLIVDVKHGETQRENFEHKIVLKKLEVEQERERHEIEIREYEKEKKCT